MKAKKLPSGKFRARVRYKENGIWRSKSFTASNRSDAEFAALQWKKTHAGDDITVGRAIERYIDDRSSVLSITTIKNYRQMMQYFDCIKNVCADDVTSQDIQKLIGEFSTNGASPKTIRNRIGFLVSVLETVVDKKFRITFPKKAPYKHNVPTDEDLKLLIDNADGELKLAIMLSAFCTLRRGEICALKGSDIRDGKVYVHADMVHVQGKEWLYKPIPKTAQSIRSVDVPPSVLALIPDVGADEFVFTIKPGIITHNFIRLRNSLNMPYRFHDLRAYAASMRSDLNIPSVYIQYDGGWKGDSILKTSYEHALQDRRKKYAAVVNDYVEKSFFS